MFGHRVKVLPLPRATTAHIVPGDMPPPYAEFLVQSSPLCKCVFFNIYFCFLHNLLLEE